MSVKDKIKKKISEGSWAADLKRSGYNPITQEPESETKPDMNSVVNGLNMVASWLKAAIESGVADKNVKAAFDHVSKMISSQR